MPYDVAKSCHLPKVSGKERVLSTNETFFFDLAPYIVIVFFPLPVGDPEELCQAFVLECLDPLSRSWTSHASRYDQLFIELELGTETDVALPYPLFTTVWPLLCAYFCVGGLD